MTNFVVDTQWFRTRNGMGVLAGSPLTQFSVTQAGAKILDALENGTDLPAHHEPLTSRLLAKGAIHPTTFTRASPSDVTVVIPTLCRNKDHVARLQKLVASLKQVAVIVVDDASPCEISLEDAVVIRHDINKGPGAARNTGATVVNTPFVVFVDDDVTIETDVVLALAAMLVDGSTHCVAPRVKSTSNEGALDDYEQFRSSLDLGAVPAVVRPTSRVSYVPSAVLAVRLDSFRTVKGFDESLRVGEDVDFVWRIVENGLVCRYEPSLVCTHLPRSTVKNFLQQRISYGSSAAALDSRHRDAVAPLRSHALLLLPPILFLSGFFLWSLPAALVSYGWFTLSLWSTKLTFVDRFRVVSIGLFSTTRLLTTAVARTWWPLFAILSFFYSPALVLFGLSVIIPPLLHIVTKRPRHPSTFFVLYVMDNFSYGLGVWSGALRARSLHCLLPTITWSSGRLRSKG